MNIDAADIKIEIEKKLMRMTRIAFLGLILALLTIGAMVLISLDKDRMTFIIAGREFMELKKVPVNDRLLGSLYENALKNDLSPYLLLAQCWAESEFDKYAVSRCGAQGYMQIMIKFWGEQFTDTNMETIYDEYENVAVGAYVLNQFRKGRGVYQGILRYNGGRAVQDERWILVTPESHYYSEKIMNALQDILLIQSKVLGGYRRNLTAK